MEIAKRFGCLLGLICVAGCNQVEVASKKSFEQATHADRLTDQEESGYQQAIAKTKARADALQRAREYRPVQYEVKNQLMPRNLDGISTEQVRQHWLLYGGYVKQVNSLLEELEQMRVAGDLESLQYADRRRRLNFEFNGMVLHEYYFGNLAKGKAPPTSGPLFDALTRSFGSFATWKQDFASAGKTRGIGWAILYADPQTGMLSNHFIAEHENGNIAGFQPILVLDVWEHAYMVDHGAQGRGSYIAAFMCNIDWDKVQERFGAVVVGKVSPRF